jgi:hypothetical protein
MTGPIESFPSTYQSFYQEKNSHVLNDHFKVFECPNFLGKAYFLKTDLKNNIENTFLKMDGLQNVFVSKFWYATKINFQPPPPPPLNLKNCFKELSFDGETSILASEIKKQRPLFVIAGILALIGFSLLFCGSVAIATGATLAISLPLLLAGALSSIASGVVAGRAAYCLRKQFICTVV